MVATAPARSAPTQGQFGQRPYGQRLYGKGARRRIAWMSDIAGVFAISTVVILVAMWFANGGIGALSAPGGAAMTFGRLTGLIAADLLLLQVLLMARIPFVERAWGQDVLTRRHRLVGETSFYLMMAHIVLITIGYTQAGHLTFLAQTWYLIVNYPGMLLAVAGTVALLVVVATSLRAARRRMRYESWHLLHLYAYVGVALVLPHELWTGADFLSSPAMTIFWWTLWGLAAGAIVFFRLALPIGRSLLHQLVVERVIEEAPGVQSVVIRGRQMVWLKPKPGQYFQWRFLTGPGWMRAHPYSVSALPDRNRLRITMRTAGDEGPRLARLRPGTRVLIEGPYGSLTADRRLHRDVLLIAAGVGITPLRGLAEHIATEPPTDGPGGRLRPSVVVLHRVSAPPEAMFAAEWDELAARYGIGVGRLVGPRGPSGSWLPATPHPVNPARYLLSLVPDIADRSIYLCGPRDWMAAVRRTLGTLHVDPSAVHQEDFAG
ncbi:MAG: ferric reductase-like transmembrane domain-containing protein [Actinobacteria bacterium]|nr:ferric reductase-like transmembrane domain-containing protein [Actinomycetota bacterium]